MTTYRTTTVFLDTSVFVGQGFNFRSKNLSRLEELIPTHNVELVTTDIVVRETRNRISTTLQEAISEHHRFTRKATILRASSTTKGLLDPLSFDDLERDLVQEFEMFLSRTKTQTLSSRLVMAGTVLDDYFNLRPPFAPGEKRKEFADAFSIAALRKWLLEEGTSKLRTGDILVVTTDQDFEAICTPESGLRFCDGLPTVLNRIIAEEAAEEECADFVKQQILDLRDDLMRRVTAAFEDRTFYVMDEDGDVEELYDIQLSLSESPDDYDLVELSVESAVVSTLVSISFKADISYNDQDTASYDSEDGTVFYHNRIEKTVLGEEDDRELEIRVSFSRDLDPDHFELFGVDLGGREPVWVNPRRELPAW